MDPGAPHLQDGAGASASDGGPNQNPELRDMTRRFWIGTALALPVFALEMGRAPVQHPPPHRAADVELVQLLLEHRSFCGPAGPFFTRAVTSVKNRSLNMFSLIALGTGAAWLPSIVATLLPGLFRRRCWRGGRCSRGLLRRLRSSRCSCCWAVLELRAREDIPAPSKALLGWRRTAVEGAPRRHGRTVRVDSIQSATCCACALVKVPWTAARRGKGNVDESMVTGEPIPVAKAVGARSQPDTPAAS